MGRNYYHDYRLLEGLLQWYFGPVVSVSYRCDPETAGPDGLVVLVNGRLVDRGRLSPGVIVKHIGDLGVKRLDD